MPVVWFDDFERLTRMSSADLADWVEQGGPLEPAMAPGFAEAVLAAGPEVVVDSPFAHLWPGFADKEGVTIWLDCPWDIALARKIGTLLEQGARDPGFADWMLPWLQNYAGPTRQSFELLETRVSAEATLVIDAETDIKSIVVYLSGKIRSC